MAGVTGKLQALGGIMAYPGDDAVGTDVTDRAIAQTDITILISGAMITQHNEVRLGSNNSSKTKAELAKSD